jgi:antitoxin MazE
MNLKIQKWGNSSAVRLPKTLLKEAGFPVECECTVKIYRRGIVLTPVKKVLQKKGKTLDEYLDQITPENRHDETPWGKDGGNEVVVW